MFDDLLLLIRDRFLERPQRPSNLYVMLEDSQMADMMRVKVLFPNEADRDTVKRIFRVYTDGTIHSDIVIPKNQPDVLFVVPQDSQVKLELINVDDSGNKSTPATYDFVAADNIPPAAPGPMSVQIVGEVITDEPPVVEEPSVVEEPPVVEELPVVEEEEPAAPEETEDDDEVAEEEIVEEDPVDDDEN